MESQQAASSQQDQDTLPSCLRCAATPHRTIQLPMQATLNPFQLSSCSSLCAPNANFNGPNPDSGAIVCKNYAAFLINYVPNVKGTPEWLEFREFSLF